MTQDSVSDIRTRNRRALLIAVAVFIAPVLVAAIVLKTGLYQSVGTTNSGQLIEPPLPFEAMPLADGNHQPLDPKQFLKKWWLVYIIPPHCDASCNNSLFQMRQIHSALGPDQSRVSRLLVSTTPISAPLQTLISQEFPNLTVAYIQPGQLSEAFSAVGDPALKEEPGGHIYLVDTMGAVFMYYPTYADEQESILKGRDLLKDLKKVLKLSKIG